MGDTHITGRHFGGDTHITSDMCVGIHISRGYTYHCDRGHRIIPGGSWVGKLKIPPGAHRIPGGIQYL